MKEKGQIQSRKGGGVRTDKKWTLEEREAGRRHRRMEGF